MKTRYITIALLLFLMPVIGFSQSDEQNFNKQTAYKNRVTVDEIETQTKDDKLETIGYYDGIGRPLQNVSIGASGNGHDMVNYITYDQNGFPTRTYLPVEDADNQYLFRPDALSKTEALYNIPKYENTTNPYSEVVYEDSPLNRVRYQAAPGADWQFDPTDITYTNPITETVFENPYANAYSAWDENNLNIFREICDSGITEIPGVDDGVSVCVLDGNLNFLFQITRGFEFKLNTTSYPLEGEYPDIELGFFADGDNNPTNYKAAIINNNLVISNDDANPLCHNGFRLLKFEDLKIEKTNVVSFDSAAQNGHLIRYEYKGNTTDEVIRYGVEFTNSNSLQPNLVHLGYYNANELTKNIVKDENWTASEGLGRTTEEYTDKLGRVILKRAYDLEEDDAGNLIPIPHDTQYVYDDFNNLSFVLSPKASDAKTVTTIGYDDFSLAIPLASIYAGLGGSLLNPGVTGNATVNLTGGDQLTVNYNITSTLPGHLRTGAIMMLPGGLQDAVLGTMTFGAYTYEVSVESGFLTLTNLGVDDFLIAGVGFNQTVTGNIPTEQVVSISNGVLNKLCYQYQYDDRNRLIRKKIPSKDWEELVYDKLDRPVLTQDPNLRAQGKWLFTKYDEFNRVVYTGFYSSSASRDDLQALVYVQTNFNESKAPNSVQNIGGRNINYTNTVFPNDNNNMETLTVNYYDSYNFTSGLALDDPTIPIFGQTITNLTQGLVTGTEVRILGTDLWTQTIMYYDDKARPIYTSTQNNYLNATDIIRTEYDFIGNVLRSETIHSKRHQQCSDGGSSNSFAGFSTCTTHFDYVVTLDEFVYDSQYRLKTHVQTQKDIDGNVVQSPELIVNNTYDEIGQLINKKIGGAVTNINALQSIDYDYTVRGWLEQINDPNQSLTDDVFAYKINYNTITTKDNGNSRLNTTPLYNGNISETIWRTASDDQKAAYGYQYDRLNRITKARYKAGDNLNEDQKFFDLKRVRYDKNGNITKLRRRAPLADFSDHEIIDKLNYKYFNNSNQLKKVNDNATSLNTDGFLDGNTSGNDYTYDNNGNLIQDLNKNISIIEYNHLNLPKRVVFSITGNTTPQNGDNAIEFVYDATGIKMEKRALIYGITTSGKATEYCGNYIYERDFLDIANNPEQARLQFFNHPEGYVEPVDNSNTTGITTYNYIYQCKDHLENIRVSISDYDKDGRIDVVREDANGILQDIDGDGQLDNEIVQAKNYYPFGLEHGYQNTSPLSFINGRNHQWTFNNKEYNNEFGLNWSDFGARNYQADLGRWMSIDNFSELYYSQSSYEYSLNNPIFFIDPDGNTVKPSFTNKENEKKFNNASNKLKSVSTIYQKVYNDLSSSYKEFKVTEYPPGSDFSSSHGRYLKTKPWGFGYDRTIQLNHKNKGFETGVVFEEFFHAAQDNYYWTKNSVRNETEAKLARDFEIFNSADSSSLEDIKKSIEEFGVSSDVSILLNDDGSLNCEAINYFTMLQNGDKIPDDLRSSFKDLVKKFASEIDVFYHFSKKDLENYDGSTDFFNSFFEN